MDYSNIRKTPQGIAILNSLKSSHNHPTANDIYQDVINKFPKISLATVYKNLNKLTKQKMIQEIYIRNEPNRFDKNPFTHYHMICSSCGDVKDLSYPVLYEIESFVSDLYNFLVSDHVFNLYGICEKCQ